MVCLWVKVQREGFINLDVVTNIRLRLATTMVSATVVNPTDQWKEMVVYLIVPKHVSVSSLIL